MILRSCEALDAFCLLADLHVRFLDALRQHPEVKLITDGVHMAPPGDRLMAEGLLQALGVSPEKLAAGR